MLLRFKPLMAISAFFLLTQFAFPAVTALGIDQKRAPKFVKKAFKGRNKATTSKNIKANIAVLKAPKIVDLN
jgi:hypothetical protein